MLNYQEYILESKIEKLLLESNIEFSNKFIQLLKNMKNPIAEELIKLKGQDKNIIQNFLDVDYSDPESVTFIQDNTAQRILGQDKDVWIISDNGKMLKFENFRTDSGKDDNKKIYEHLGLEMSEASKIPNQNEVKIIKEDQSPLDSNKTYCYVETIKEPIQKMVINKSGISPKSIDYKKVWTESRNNMRIGRIVRKLIPFTGKRFSDVEIEKFVNDWKSAINILNDAFIKFDVVEGDAIHHWYQSRNCVLSGTIGNSCMLDKPEECHYIYTANPHAVKLVILYSDNGSIIDGKYKSDLIEGRALLWNTNEGDMFMDRIYYVKDEQKDLFKKYAEKMGWWSKKDNNSSPDLTVVQGEKVKNDVIYTVDLKKWSWGFPYVDTLCFFNEDNGELTNQDNDETEFYCPQTKCLQETWDHYDEDFDDD
jgi:hypothetical protein